MPPGVSRGARRRKRRCRADGELMVRRPPQPGRAAGDHGDLPAQFWQAAHRASSLVTAPVLAAGGGSILSRFSLR